MQDMQQYVNTLKDQMFQREKKLQESRVQDMKFVEETAKSTEEIRKEM